VGQSQKSIDINTRGLIKITLVSAIVGALIGAVLGGLINGFVADYYNKDTLQMQQKNDLKILANEFLNDIAFVDYSESTFEDYRFNPSSDFNNPNSSFYKQFIKWEDPIYPQWGMYYSNRQDLNKFNVNLSRKLVDFYSKVLTAESQRDEFNNYDTLFPIDQNNLMLRDNRNNNLKRIWNNMAGNINSSRSSILSLRSDLQHIIDTGENFDSSI